MTDNTQSDALDLADWLDGCGGLTSKSAAAELRRLHARIADLEAHLEAIVAGGVNGPLIGQPQAMPDLSQLTERGAVAWAGVDAQGLRDGGASLSANAGGEPVAEVVPCHTPSGKRVALRSDAQGLPIGTKLYTNPSPQEGMAGRTKLPGTLPKPGTPVLLDIGKKYPIRAMWAAKHTVQAADDDTDWGEYDEATDEYWCPEGWYEWNQNEDNHWRVTETPRAWMPLPSSPSMDGESNG